MSAFWKSCVSEALDALSLMIRKDVKLVKSSIKIERINNIPKLMSPEEVSTTLVYTKLSGILNSVIITSSSLKHFLGLIDILLNKKINYYEALNEENKSSVLELGSIINDYFISSLDKLFNTRLSYEDSELSVNPFRAVEDFNFGNIYVDEINVLTFEAEFKVESEDIEGKIILLMEENKIDLILERIGKKIKLEL